MAATNHLRSQNVRFWCCCYGDDCAKMLIWWLLHLFCHVLMPFFYIYWVLHLLFFSSFFGGGGLRTIFAFCALDFLCFSWTSGFPLAEHHSYVPVLITIDMFLFWMRNYLRWWYIIVLNPAKMFLDTINFYVITDKECANPEKHAWYQSLLLCCIFHVMARSYMLIERGRGWGESSPIYVAYQPLSSYW